MTKVYRVLGAHNTEYEIVRKSWFSRFERAVFICQWLSCTPFTQGHFWCHHCIPFPENVDFDILYGILLTFWIKLYVLMCWWRPSWKPSWI